MNAPNTSREILTAAHVALVNIPESGPALPLGPTPVGQGGDTEKHPASFRDPSGFMFRSPAGELLRQVNASYAAEYRQLMTGGLYGVLTNEDLLIRHEELPLDTAYDEQAIAVLKPELLPFISYPYEWCFSQLKDAALLTLKVQKRALQFGMSLKDASAYNVQFRDHRPVFIDSLSFDIAQAQAPWVAYGQFCRHFVAPLALMSQVDIRLNRLLNVCLDGIPLDMAHRMLPTLAKCRPRLAIHLGLHARACRAHQQTSGSANSQAKRKLRVSPTALLGLLESLENCLEGLRWNPRGTEWEDYYDNLSYDPADLSDKERIVQRWIAELGPRSVWDLGANTGRFSRLASRGSAHTVAFDIDPGCVERNYLAVRANQEPNLLPLLMDLTNPSGGIGWAHAERSSLQQRGPVEMVLALALIHHLAITNNVPLSQIAAFFRQLTNQLVVEWVPKSDPQTQRLLRHRPDIFPDYDQSGFEQAFGQYFQMVSQQPVGSDGRILYRMQSR